MCEKCPYSEFFWSVFSPNAGKYGPEKLRIWTLFTQWELLRYEYFKSIIAPKSWISFSLRKTNSISKKVSSQEFFLTLTTKILFAIIPQDRNIWVIGYRSSCLVINAKAALNRSSLEWFFWKILQNSQKNGCNGILFFVNLQFYRR